MPAAESKGVDAATGVWRVPPLFGASAMTELGLEAGKDVAVDNFGWVLIEVIEGASTDFEDNSGVSVTAVPGGGTDLPLVAVISDNT